MRGAIVVAGPGEEPQSLLEKASQRQGLKVAAAPRCRSRTCWLRLEPGQSVAIIEQHHQARTLWPASMGFLVQSVRTVKPPDRSPAPHERKLSTQHTWATWCTPSTQLSPRVGHPRPTSANSALSTHVLLGVLPPRENLQPHLKISPIRHLPHRRPRRGRTSSRRSGRRRCCRSRSGQTGGMTDEDLRGGAVIAIAPQTLRWAVDQMVKALGPEKLKKLKVSAGEHLAALLASTFLLTPPTGVDTQGGPDLWFDLSREPGNGKKRAPILPGGTTSAAFEIKSMPGPFREWNSGIDRDGTRGIDTIGRSFETQVRVANDVLREAGPTLRRARDQLQQKTTAGTSRNIFLVVHLFDYLVAESMRPILGPSLSPLADIEGVDSVWVLWPLEHLTVWSTERHAWTDLLFNTGRVRGAESAPDDTELDVLQDAENYYLASVGHTGGSPYLFHISADEETTGD